MSDQSEMARNAIQSDFQTSKMAVGTKKICIKLKWPKLRLKVNFGNPKLPIDLEWPEMRSKVNFGHPKWPRQPFCQKCQNKIKVAYRSEMARNAIENEIRTSKMTRRQPFCQKFQKKLKLRIDVKWIEMRSKVIF